MTMKKEIIVIDKRIDRNHSICYYLKLAQEVIVIATGMTGRKLGGYVCTYGGFTTTSRGRDCQDSQIDVQMDFNKNLAKLTVWTGTTSI